MKWILMLALASLLCFSVVGLAGDEIGVRSLLGEQFEVTITKTISLPFGELEMFYDHGAFNALLGIDLALTLTKEPYLAGFLNAAGGGRFGGTFWPIEELELGEMAFQLDIGGGVNSEYFAAQGDFLIRFQADGIQFVPSVSVTIYDWVIWDTLEGAFAKKIEGDE